MRNFYRILVVSDIHGDNEKFLGLLEKAEYNPSLDLLVVCGDMIDRGRENLKTIATCRALQSKGAILLKGNHEQFAQECIKDMLMEKQSEALQVWVNYNGGSNFYDELLTLDKEQLKDILKFVETLPLYFSIDNFIFTHAGANSNKLIEKNSEDEVVWMKKSFPYCPAYRGKTLIFGHEPTWNLGSYDSNFKRGNAKIWFDTINKDKIGIDCGSCFGGRMGILELPTYREFYV